ncbi:MAG: endonuclease/exonuclease/phosphatase family protein [Weeksellaceae bacterium]|nr:endonuclease/exonuclease/phosphatase family protein [Weeksellaceae bacterium]
MNFKLILFLVSCLLASFSYAQQKQLQAATVAFYNVENLFDTIPSAGYIDGTLDYQDQRYHITIPLADTAQYEYEPFRQSWLRENIEGKKLVRSLILIDEFTPGGTKSWNTQKFNQKLTNLSKVITGIGADVTKTAPVIVGLCEVESRAVTEALAQHPTMQPYNYGVVHYNSLDKRGIDVALLYQKDRFVVQNTEKIELIAYDGGTGYRDYTRDILLVSGLLDGERMHFLVNHWPSRRGGEAASFPKRKAAAELLKKSVERIQASEPNAKIIIMGDFNDDPVSPSIKNVLGSVGKKDQLQKGDLYNAMEPLYRKGFGTLAYRDGWNLFDQIILSKPLIGNDYSSYQEYRTNIYSPSFLVTKSGQWKGYPNRMYGGDTYNPFGYSDHFPVYTILVREIKAQ